MNRYGGIDINGYTEYLSNLGQIARLGQRFTKEDIMFEYPYTVEKPEQTILEDDISYENGTEQ